MYAKISEDVKQDKNEKLFDILTEIHHPEHCKGCTSHDRCMKQYCNISRGVCKIFSNTCITYNQKNHFKKSTAGCQPILTNGFGANGQVIMVDFQTMPDGNIVFMPLH
jgi:hypothetical protein